MNMGFPAFSEYLKAFLWSYDPVGQFGGADKTTMHLFIVFMPLIIEV
jgi:hypothetical protein